MLQQKQKQISSHTTTYYIEGINDEEKYVERKKIGPIGCKKEKRNFGRATLMKKKTEIVNGEVKERKRSGRYGTKRRYKKNVIKFFYGLEVVNFFTHFLCIEFHSSNATSIEKNNFDKFVKILCFCPIFSFFWSIFCKFLTTKL